MSIRRASRPTKACIQIMAESIRGALDDAGLTIKDVDGTSTAGMGMGAMGIVGFCDYLNLTPNFVDGTNIGGSSFVAHTAHAAAAIQCRTVRSRGGCLRIDRGLGALRDRHRWWRRRRRSLRPVRISLRSDHRRRLCDDRAAPYARIRHHARAARRNRRHDAPCTPR